MTGYEDIDLELRLARFEQVPPTDEEALAKISRVVEFVESIRVGDFPVVQGVVLILAGFTILANLAADIGSAAIDPRIRFA